MTIFWVFQVISRNGTLRLCFLKSNLQSAAPRGAPPPTPRPWLATVPCGRRERSRHTFGRSVGLVVSGGHGIVGPHHDWPLGPGHERKGQNMGHYVRAGGEWGQAAGSGPWAGKARPLATDWRPSNDSIETISTPPGAYARAPRI